MKRPLPPPKHAILAGFACFRGENLGKPASQRIRESMAPTIASFSYLMINKRVVV
jgi:hypothetical protein